MDLYIDATNKIAGRLASVTARQLLRGDRVIIVNAEKAVITGQKKATQKTYKQKVERGDPYHGPFYPKYADAILKRMVRGMVNHHSPHGKQAFSRLRVYRGVPEEYAKASLSEMKEIERKKGEKYISLGDLATFLGGS